MENTKQQIKEKDLDVTAKLLSAQALGNSFIYIDNLEPKSE